MAIISQRAQQAAEALGFNSESSLAAASIIQAAIDQAVNEVKFRSEKKDEIIKGQDETIRRQQTYIDQAAEKITRNDRVHNDQVDALARVRDQRDRAMRESGEHKETCIRWQKDNERMGKQLQGANETIEILRKEVQGHFNCGIILSGQQMRTIADWAAASHCIPAQG